MTITQKQKIVKQIFGQETGSFQKEHMISMMQEYRNGIKALAEVCGIDIEDDIPPSVKKNKTKMKNWHTWSVKELETFMNSAWWRCEEPEGEYVDNDDYEDEDEDDDDDDDDWY